MKGLLITYAVVYGGALLALVDPFWGLLAWVVYSTLKPEVFWWWAVPPSNYGQVIAGCYLFSWLLRGTGNWKLMGAWPIFWFLVAYWLWKIPSAMFAWDQTVAWAEVDRQTRILVPVLAGFALVDSVPKLKYLAWTYVLTIGYAGFEMNLDSLQGGFRLEVSGLFGMDNNSACIALVTGMGMAFFLGLGVNSIILRYFCFFIAALQAHCPMFGDSRGGMLGAMFTGAVTPVLLRKEPKTWWLLGLALMVGLSLAGPRVMEGFNSIFVKEELRDDSANSRIVLWGQCWDAMTKNPIFGLGPDQWEIAAQKDYGWTGPKASHSLWFNTGAEMGFPGLLFLVAFYVVAMWKCWPIAQLEAEVDPFLRTSARMVIAGLVSFMVSASFVSLDRLEPPYFVVLLGAGCVRIADTHRELKKSAQRQPAIASPGVFASQSPVMGATG